MQLYETIDTRDVVQIAILALVVFGFLRFLHRTGAGSTIGRGLGMVVVGLFFLAQVVVVSLDWTELGAVLDYLLFALLLVLAILFQPELRRGLMMLGKTRLWQGWAPVRHAVADPLADAAEALSRDGIGALIVIERDINLAPYIETGQRIDGRLSSSLIRTVFTPRSPLHDGAVVLVNGRVVAAGCQLPMRSYDQAGEATMMQKYGMRHRAALCLSEETDAIVLVISEETGRISLASGGSFEPVPRENIARRLVALLSAAPVPKAA